MIEISRDLRLWLEIILVLSISEFSISEIRNYYLPLIYGFVRGNGIPLPTGPLWRPEQWSVIMTDEDESSPQR